MAVNEYFGGVGKRGLRGTPRDVPSGRRKGRADLP